MRIRRLDACGFKSFLNRTTITFGEGITSIVGPNGCGKSNVVDAIRWCMGEQSAKHLRGRSMDDVIFGGSEKNAPTNMAEVSLTFDVEGHDLPKPYQGLPEVTVSRRLFRTGESEYLVNGVQCRLLDITELFLGTGIGTKAYSIIEQGRVGLIVSAKPEDRRAFIDEAAGVTKYKARRKAAERKLEHTEQNLLRVSDVLAELKTRLESLHRQAKKAERYRRIKGEIREMELKAASHRYLELISEQKRAVELADLARREEEELNTRIAAIEAAIASARQKLAEEENALAQAAERAFATENSLSVARANLAAFAREAETLASGIARASAELDQARAAEAAQAEERAQLEAEAEKLSRESEVTETALAEAIAKKSACEDGLKSLAAELASERERLVAAIGRVAEAKNRQEALARQKTDFETRSARAFDELTRASEAIVGLECTMEEMTARLSQGRQHRLTLEERRGMEGTALEHARREAMEAEVRLVSFREELSDRRSRLASLREIEKNYEGAGRGVRTVMQREAAKTVVPPDSGNPDPASVSVEAQQVEQRRRVLGLVADMVRAPTEIERAIEAVLGDRLSAVVVSSIEDAVDLARDLRSSDGGRATFLPSVPTLRTTTEINRSVAGVLGAAVNLVQFAPENAAVVKSLLDDVVIVQDLAAAAAYSRFSLPHTIVTLDGEIIDPSGALTGGSNEGPGTGALGKKREIATLDDEVKRLDIEVRDFQEKSARIHARIATLEASLAALQADTHQKEIALVQDEKDLSRVSDELLRMREAADAAALEREQLARTLEELGVEIHNHDSEVLRAEADRASRESTVEGLTAAAAERETESQSLTATVTELRVKVAQDAERREAVSRSLAKAAARAAELAEQLGRLSREVVDAEARRARLIEDTANTETQIQTLSRELADAQTALERDRKVHEEAKAKVAADEESIRADREALSAIAARVNAAAMKEREIELEISHLRSQITEKYATNLTDELSRFHALPAADAEEAEHLAELRAQIERMGEINLTAIEEHEEVRKRFEFLTNQKADLEASIAKLRGAITRVNRTSRERFKETFEIVNQKFQQVFPRLFNGGRAELILVEGTDVLEAGVDIVAQPPGKRLQNVNLLSGGEKALTAVAMIFAIFLVKPSPFCLLDEVDAPLDDSNVDRYNNVVLEMAKQSQFIVITHNKRTMQIADTLYGVTMEEPGVSRVVSVRIREDAAAGAVAAR
jgi:chromosome segregation protein